MSRPHEGTPDDPQLEKGLNRRDFVKMGAVTGLVAAALPVPAKAQVQVSASTSPDDDWDYEADFVIAGGGCAGLTAAIRARDLGATVLVVDQNFDLGGRMLHSGAFTSLRAGYDCSAHRKSGCIRPANPQKSYRRRGVISIRRGRLAG